MRRTDLRQALAGPLVAHAIAVTVTAVCTVLTVPVIHADRAASRLKEGLESHRNML